MTDPRLPDALARLVTSAAFLPVALAWDWWSAWMAPIVPDEESGAIEGGKVVDITVERRYRWGTK